MHAGPAPFPKPRRSQRGKPNSDVATRNLSVLCQRIQGRWSCTYTFHGKEKSVAAEILAYVKKEDTNQPGINIDYKIDGNTVNKGPIRFITPQIQLMYLQIMDLHLHQEFQRKGYGTVLFAILWGPLHDCSYEIL